VRGWIDPIASGQLSWIVLKVEKLAHPNVSKALVPFFVLVLKN
jgi:hypothetical protein